MTLEAFHFTETIPVIPVNEDERLLLEKELVRRQLARSSVVLSEAQIAHHELILRSIQLNAEIARRAIDTSLYATQIQQPEQFYDVIHGFDTDDTEDVAPHDELDRIS